MSKAKDLQNAEVSETPEPTNVEAPEPANAEAPEPSISFIGSELPAADAIPDWTAKAVTEIPREVINPHVGQITAHFTWEEARCRHCHKLPDDVEPVKEAAAMMEELRRIINKPIIVDSWYRCPVHNADIGGASHSQHLLGRAVDFVIKDVAASQVQGIIRHLYPSVIHGMGSYPGFTHVDCRTGLAAKWSR